MNTPDTSKPIPSAPHTAHPFGHFPKRKGTVAAEVLCRLLEGERLSSLDAVYSSSTTRLAAVIHLLGKSWLIDRESVSVATKDGRVADVTEYFMSPTLIHQARLAGSDMFCEAVRQARAQQRQKVNDMTSIAYSRNNARHERVQESRA